MTNLTGLIKSIRDIMREDRGINGDAQRIEQMAWMLFLKIFDDKDLEMETLNKKYRSPIPKPFQWRSWAADDEGMTGDQLSQFVDQQLFPALRSIRIGNDGRAKVVREVFEGNNNYMKSGINLRKVLNKLNLIDFNRSEERHLFGDIYETILRELQSAGKAGEFYTPRAVTQFMTEMIDPKLGEHVLDPACGTGGFLVNTIEHLRPSAKTVELRKIWQETIKGIEWKPLPYVLATTNLVLHDVEVPNISYDDALSKPLNEYKQADKVDIILANPPFGGTVANNNENNFPANFRTKESADLFLVLFMRLLKDRGRAAIVLPDGSLTGEGVKQRIRQELLEQCNLHTIIRLPNSVFQPYATVATNLLFFEKGKPTKDIWYYQHKLPEGQKSYSKTKSIVLKEFDPIRKWWDKRKESDVAWKVNIKTIKENDFDLDCKNPHEIFDEIIPAHSIAKTLELCENSIQDIKTNFLESISKSSINDIEILYKYFDVICEEPRGVKELTNYILEAAIHGRLVPQEPDDEPADKLLDLIREEKNKIISGKKINGQKQLTPIKSELIPYELPDGWAWCRLGKVVEHEWQYI